MRIKGRLHTLEKALDAQFNTNNEMEFYHSFSFTLKEVDFNKLLLCKTESLGMDDMFEADDETLITKLRTIKEQTIAQKSEEVT